MGVGLPSGTVTFLFTDIEGSTGLWEAAADAMRSALERHDSILNAAIEANDGYVFSTGGDGLAAVFARAGDALSAATQAQSALAAETWSTSSPVRVRMGVHTGEATERDGDYFGPAVNRAARLMAAGHGGQVLVSAIAAGVLGTSGLTDLGEHRLRDLAEPQRVFQVGQARFPSLRSLDVALTNLPNQPTSLVGRQPLIAELAALVESCLLVTLTGVGGVGKTRLAVEVGAEVLPKFPDGVWLVDLAPVAHDELVLQTIADALGVAAQTGEPLITTMVSRMRSKRLLVILDNCEHVLTPVARMAQRVAASASGVRMLATSREPLGVAGEQVWGVPSLAESTEAVELFVERARQADNAFDAEGHLDAIREICVRLDGLPLAIELAAARARMLSPAQIAERLNQRFRLLTGGGRTAIERHRTLQATVAWSYGLLDPVDQVVFQRLSTMAGSFDIEAAEAVASGGIVEGWEVIDALGRLVDKSMVLTVRDGSAVRYRLLETLRQFGADRLAEQPDAPEVHDGYAHYWCTRAVASGRAASGIDRVAALDAIEADVDNYRAAFSHLLTTGGVSEAARGVLALDPYWQIRRIREGMRWYDQLLGHPDLDPQRRITALSYAGYAACSFGDISVGERYVTEAIAEADAAGLAPSWQALSGLLMVARARGDGEAHARYWVQAREAAKNSGSLYLQLITEATRAGPLFRGEDGGELIDHYERLLGEVRQHGDPLLVALAASSLSRVLYISGESARSMEIMAVALAHAERAGPTLLGVMLHETAAVAVLSGHVDQATAALTRGLPLSLHEGLTNSIIQGAFVAAALAARRGDVEVATTLITAGIRHADPLGIASVWGFTDECRMGARAAVDSSAGDLGAARARGAAMTIDDLVNYALDTFEGADITT